MISGLLKMNNRVLSSSTPPTGVWRLGLNPWPLKSLPNEVRGLSSPINNEKEHIKLQRVQVVGRFTENISLWLVQLSEWSLPLARRGESVLPLVSSNCWVGGKAQLNNSRNNCSSLKAQEKRRGFHLAQFPMTDGMALNARQLSLPTAPNRYPALN